MDQKTGKEWKIDYQGASNKYKIIKNLSKYVEVCYINKYVFFIMSKIYFTFIWFVKKILFAPIQFLKVNFFVAKNRGEFDKSKLGELEFSPVWLEFF